jgi:hypothetical protein
MSERVVAGGNELSVSSFEDFPESALSGFVHIPAKIAKSGCLFTDSVKLIDEILENGRRDCESIDYQLRMLRNILPDLKRKQLIDEEMALVRRLENHLTCIHYKLSAIYEADISFMQRVLQQAYYQRPWQKKASKRERSPQSEVMRKSSHIVSEEQIKVERPRQNAIKSGMKHFESKKFLGLSEKSMPYIFNRTAVGIGYARLKI